MTKMEATAYHEAGHFVVSYLLSPSTYRGRVTIIPDERAGNLGSARAEEWWSEDMARADVLVSMAGWEAQRRVDPEADPRGSQSDIENARYILEKLGEVGNEQEWRTRAGDLVEENWVAVETLAHELMKANTLEADEAEIIVDIARGEEGATWEALARYQAMKEAGKEGESE